MIDELVVVLQSRPIGTVVRSGPRDLVFSYDDEYRRWRGATPLSLSMPLTTKSHGNDVVEAYMWGLLPDDQDVLRDWGQEFHVSPTSAFGLLANMGEDCAGAVQFVPPGQLDHATRAGEVRWIDEAEIAQRLRDMRANKREWRVPHHSGRFSLAGAQAKFALLRDGDRWGEPSGHVPTTHILKPGADGFRDHALNEYLCLRAAQILGVGATNSEMLQFEDQTALVVERFDRFHDGQRWIRIHQEDMCQALAVHPDNKYESEGGPSAADIAQLLWRSIGPRFEAERAVRHFTDGLILNYLLGGTDAHAKNYCVLLSGPDVRLGPLYDVSSYYPYARRDLGGVTLAMRIGGNERVIDVSAAAWARTAEELGLEPDEVIRRIADLGERLPDALAQARDEAPQVGSSMVDHLIEEVLETRPLLLASCREPTNAGPTTDASGGTQSRGDSHRRRVGPPADPT